MTGILNARQHKTLEIGESFSLVHRLYSVAWGIDWSVFASWTAPPLHRSQWFILVLFGAKIAPTAGVYSSPRIWYRANLEMGEFSFLGPGVNCYSMDRITIGAYVLVSQGGHLCAGSHDISDPNFQLIGHPFVVQPQAWIAAETLVGTGVTVDDGAVLGALGVAFKTLDPWTLDAGNPAQPSKTRIISEGSGVIDRCLAS